MRNARAVGRDVGSGSVVVSSDDLYSSLSICSFPMLGSRDPLYSNFLVATVHIPPIITLVSADSDLSDLNNDSLSVQTSTCD